MMAILFRTTKALEGEIDEYLDYVSQGVLVFVEGIKNFLNKDWTSFEDHLKTIDKLEGKADSLRRNIETNLYSQSLIPEHRGDVLGLLESMDDVIDTAKETVKQFDVERPYIPDEYHPAFIELAEMASNAGESVVLASRAFFNEVKLVKDHLHKVYFYEKEADKISNRIKRNAFSNENIDLSHKFHIRYFALHIDTIADRAENLADRLAIYTIKRTI